MHSALLISEVLGSIVDCLAEDVHFPAEDACQRALAVLARTCRAFSKPALDALWRRLYSLEPLMLCLPTKASYDDEVDGTLPPFNEEEWSIVLRYTPRVQELTIEQDDNLSVKILQSLWFRTTLLLPNLRKLRCAYGDDTAVASIRLLLSPSLVQLEMRLADGDHTSILGFLESCHTLCPNLKSFHIGYSSHLTAAISRAITRFPNLETLSCDDIDEAALIHIAESRCLKKFTSSFLDYEPDTLRRLARHETPDRPPFKNLRILELSIRDLFPIIPSLKPQYQPFEEVSFCSHTVSTPEVFQEFFTALSSVTRCRTLRRVTLSTYYLIGFGMSPPPVNFQVLSPLMALDLYELHININNPISLNDDEFVRLVQAWPELETLNLNQHSGWDYPPSVQIPTLRGLLLLLGRCLKLCHLGLCVDAANLPSLSEDESSIRNTAITRLSVSNSPIQEPATRVTHFLLEHLPSLTTVLVWESIARQMHYHWTWKKVDREIKEILGQSSPEWRDDEMDVM